MNAKKKKKSASAAGKKPGSGPLDVELEFICQEQDSAGNSYDLYLGRISRNPVVRSHATGKYCMLPWSEIIAIAVEHGIGKK
jgi:hypothetical protein